MREMRECGKQKNNGNVIALSSNRKKEDQQEEIRKLEK